MKKFFFIKGCHDVNTIVEINGKTYAKTIEGLFRMRENLHSNSFLLSPGFKPVSKIFELSQVNYKEIYDSLAFSSFREVEFKDFRNILNENEMESFCKQFYLYREGTKITKIEIKEIVRILKYMQSITRIEDFMLYETTNEESSSSELISNSKIRDWAANYFEGTSIELGFFILLLNIKSLENFIIEWKKADLYEIDLKGLLVFVDKSYLDQTTKAKVKSYLNRLV